MTKRITLLVFLALAIGECLCAGCGRYDSTPSQSHGNSLNPSREPATPAHPPENQPSDKDRQKAMDALLEQHWKETEEMMRTGRGLKVEKRLPNPWCGPGRPEPDYVNFYEVHDDYPAYLLCTFKVNEQHYDPSNEPAWFKSALLQMRHSGSQAFWPTLRWVAVIVLNSAEARRENTPEQCRKVGAIFDLKDVFDPSRAPAKLIAQAQMDRHPFVYDPKPVIPWKQDHWMIVERHAASDTKTIPKTE